MLWTYSRLIVVGCVGACVASGAEYTVDLNRPNRYAAIFEAGLHPRYPNGMGEIMVEVRPDAAIGFKLLNWHIPPLKAVWGFKINRTENISLLRGVVSAAWTKSEAYEIVAPLERALGGDEESLKKMKAWIDGYPETAVEGDTWGRTAFSEDQQISAAYYFRHTMQPARPLSCTVIIQFPMPPEFRGFHHGLLKPPPGYEHLDLSTDYTYGGTVPGPATASEAGSESVNGGSGSPPPVGSRPSGNLPWWLPWLVILVVAALWWAMRGGKAASR